MKGWVTFVENHDEPRLLTEFPNISETAYASLIQFIFVSPGVPMLAYGTETGLALPYHPNHSGLFGMGGEPFNRMMMIWPGDPGWNPNLFETVRRMAHLRQDKPVLRYGDTRYLYPRNSNPKDDLFMLRESKTCDVSSVDCDRVLYAYSTFGGEYLISLNQVDLEVRTTRM
ncbi:MAG: hypothetical protein HC925_01185 [Coleofasciculaceae cyanobacterium SM2_3_26]|nr:hypothetical protein [Coleofasciculaceae cyanobacterium SM2_3_26]